MTFFRGNPRSENDSQVRHREKHCRRRLRVETLEQRFLMAVGRYEALSNILDQYVSLYDTEPDSFKSHEAFLDTIAPYRLARASAQALAITEITDASQPLNEPYRSEAITEIDALLESARPFLDSRALATADSSTKAVASPPTPTEINQVETESAIEPLVAIEFEPPTVPLQSLALPSQTTTLPRVVEPILDERISTEVSQQLDAIESSKFELTNITESVPTDNAEHGVESSVGSKPKQDNSAFYEMLRDGSRSSDHIVTTNLFLNYSNDFASVRLFSRGQSDSIKSSNSSEGHSSDINEEETSIPHFESKRSDDRTAIARPKKSEQGHNKEKDSEPQNVIDRLLDELAYKNPTLDFSLGNPDWEVRYQRVPLSLFPAFDAKSSVSFGPYVACNYELWPEEHFKPQDRLTQRVEIDKQIVEHGFGQYRHMPMQLIEDAYDGLSDHQRLAQECDEALISNEPPHLTSSFLSGWSAQSWSYVAVLLATLTTLARPRRTRKESNSSKDFATVTVGNASSPRATLFENSRARSGEMRFCNGK